MLTLMLVNGRQLATAEDCLWHFRRIKRVETVIFQVEAIFNRNGLGIAPDVKLWPQYIAPAKRSSLLAVKGHFLEAAYDRIREIERDAGMVPGSGLVW